MSRYNQGRDLLRSSEWDLYLDSGRLGTTENYQYRMLNQKIDLNMGSSSGDLRLTPEIGANLKDFVGRPNSREVGNELKTRIEQVLGQVLVPGDFQLRVFPIAEHTIGIILQIAPKDKRGQINRTFTYDMRDNKLIPRNV